MVIRSVEYAGTCSLSKCYAAYKGFYSLKRLIAVLWTPSPSPKSVLTARPLLTERVEKGFRNSPGRTKASLHEKSYWVSKLKRNSQANMMSLLKEKSHKKHVFSNTRQIWWWFLVLHFMHLRIRWFSLWLGKLLDNHEKHITEVSTTEREVSKDLVVLQDFIPTTRNPQENKQGHTYAMLILNHCLAFWEGLLT